MKTVLFTLIAGAIIAFSSCTKRSDVFTTAVHNDRADTIVLEKHFSSNGAMHEIPIHPGVMFYLFEKQGDWAGVAMENKMRYDSLIIVVDSIRIHISRDSSSHFNPNPFTHNSGWEESKELDEDENTRHLFYLSIPEDSVWFE